MKLRIYAFIFSILFYSNSYKAQNPIIDSLKKITLKVDNDSAAKLYVKIANIFTGVNSDSVRKYASIASLKASKNSISQGDVLVQFGNSYHMENKIDSALNYYNKALLFFHKINNNKGVGKVYQSFSVVKNSTGDILGAIEDSKKAAEIYKKINWTLGLVNVYNNISTSYVKMHNYNSAIIYARLSFSNTKLLNDSLKYYLIMSSYGSKLCYSTKIDSAIYYIKTSSPFLEKNNMYNSLIPAYINLAVVLTTKGFTYHKVVKNALFKAQEYSILSGAVDNLRFVYRDIALIYLVEKKDDSAKYYFTKTLDIIDTLALQEGMRLTQDMEAKYETEKKELQIKNQRLEINTKQKENEAKNKALLIGTIGLICIALFALIAFVNYRKTKKQNLIIKTQKIEVELKNSEIIHQKELVDIKQTEIIDSINYAKRIQQAVLTGESVWSKISKEYFILFKPKDIVSGDFYWAYNTPNGRSVFALADCTGHGVPGGFMSMLGNSFLNEIVVENKIFKSNEILNKLRAKIIAALEQKGVTQQKDGMDISLCVWNKIDNTLEFSGANNPLWLLRNKEIIEYKADKMPIGAYLETQLPFSSIVIQLQQNDIIYLSTDGYADQFGGPKGKKFKYRPFLQLLIDIGHDDLSIQKEKLQSSFQSWKSTYEQVDDICVLGIKVV